MLSDIVVYGLVVLMKPARISINPPVKVEWKGKDLYVSNAQRTLNKLGLAPDEEQEFLAALHKVAPRLVKAGKTSTVSLQRMFSYLLSLSARWRSKIVLVNETEMQRRVEICKGCEFNQPVAGCTECSQIARLLMGVPRIQELRHRGCALCGCYLEVKPWLDKSMGVEQINWPDHCWNNALSNTEEPPAPTF